MLVLDSDVLIDVLRGHPPAVAWLAGLEEVPSIPGFVAMELIQDATDKVRIERAMRLIAPMPRLWPTAEDCERALTDYRELHLGSGLGLLDALIGATVRGRRARLCTFNSRHYRVLGGLELLRPYRR